ncbi:MAG: glucose-1-phosphate cytidylyltransferase [Euryarchaeota archaeon]|nr:glucose-1-phosphate cytidylyltransferase [Euryarchaeota archaeon]MBU4071858.1 glucose-1-phosphate cytidylyltransferase [Candidatus Thermoplasmatota archaeon]
MKVVILAGGYGSRISEETVLKPKPMIEIGGKPIIWHVMKMYSHFGYNDFIICLGYKGYIIKEYFTNYFLHMSDITIDLKNNKTVIHNNFAEPWRITFVDTGEETKTGGRIKRIKPYIGDETFMLTYGDGVGDINIETLLSFHKKQGKYATVTAVQPPGRFGAISINNEGVVDTFNEKPAGDGGLVNGGFFVLEPKIFDYLKDDQTIWERTPLESLANEGQLNAYQHKGFWQPLDTLRDKNALEEIWESGKPPWKIWI